ncbi:MAG: hypothetical protein ACXVEF_22710 [Polyangiales bacterium]
MPDLKPLQHEAADKKDDQTLRREAEIHLAKHPALQVVGDLLVRLRARELSWWTADDMRALWPIRERMRWFRERPDIRAQIVTSLTQLPAKAARKKTPDFQADLVDSFLEDGDVTTKQCEEAFDGYDLAVYGPAAEFWRRFRERMPWHEEGKATQEIASGILRAILQHGLLSAIEIRSAIGPTVWQSKVPLDVRVAIDEARLRREKSGEPFGATQELAIATPELLATHIPARDLLPVIEAATKALGWDGGSASVRPSPLRVVEPHVDPDEILAAISRKAANASRTSSTPPPPRISVRGDDEKTQPRIQSFAR